LSLVQVGLNIDPWCSPTCTSKVLCHSKYRLSTLIHCRNWIHQSFLHTSLP